jgi:hypothetical protein
MLITKYFLTRNISSKISAFLVLSIFALTSAQTAFGQINPNQTIESPKKKAENLKPKKNDSNRKSTDRQSLDSAEIRALDGSILRFASYFDWNLARRFAPVVFHEKDEPNKPTNVDWFLLRTSLWYYDKGVNKNICLVTGSLENSKGAWNATPPCANNYDLTQTNIRWERLCDGTVADSENSYDKEKQKTYYFRDVHPDFRSGNADMTQWTTYVHMYNSGENEITIQYWRFYPYQKYKAKFLGVELPVEASHGGDWEAAMVVVKNNEPVAVHLTGHSGISTIRRPSGQPWSPNSSWGELKFENGHPLILSEKGGHAGSAFNGDEANYIRQNTWTYSGGDLAPMGSYEFPNEWFVRYSGLWGTPPDLLNAATIDIPGIGKKRTPPGGYWSPSFNGADEENGFAKGWCIGMNPPTDIECKAKK